MIPDPGVHFIVKDWGINPYDPPETFDGLAKLNTKELKRMLKVMAELPTDHPIIGMSGDVKGLIIQIMGVVYFNNNTYFYEDTEEPMSSKLVAFIDSYRIPSRVLNWSDDYLVSFMRKQGMFLARIDYK